MGVEQRRWVEACLVDPLISHISPGAHLGRGTRHDGAIDIGGGQILGVVINSGPPGGADNEPVRVGGIGGRGGLNRPRLPIAQGVGSRTRIIPNHSAPVGLVGIRALAVPVLRQEPRTRLGVHIPEDPLGIAVMGVVTFHCHAGGIADGLGGIAARVYHHVGHGVFISEVVSQVEG